MNIEAYWNCLGIKMIQLPLVIRLCTLTRNIKLSVKKLKLCSGTNTLGSVVPIFNERKFMIVVMLTGILGRRGGGNTNSYLSCIFGFVEL